jgi:hypothetical protein
MTLPSRFEHRRNLARSNRFDDREFRAASGQIEPPREDLGVVLAEFVPLSHLPVDRRSTLAWISRKPAIEERLFPQKGISSSKRLCQFISITNSSMGGTSQHLSPQSLFVWSGSTKLPDVCLVALGLLPRWSGNSISGSRVRGRGL